MQDREHEDRKKELFPTSGVPCGHILPYDPSWMPAERLLMGGRGVEKRNVPKGGAA